MYIYIFVQGNYSYTSLVEEYDKYYSLSLSFITVGMMQLKYMLLYENKLMYKLQGHTYAANLCIEYSL